MWSEERIKQERDKLIMMRDKNKKDAEEHLKVGHVKDHETFMFFYYGYAEKVNLLNKVLEGKE